MAKVRIDRHYVEQRLQTIAQIDYLNTGFVHDKAFSTVQVDQKTGLIPEMGLDAMRYFGSTKRNTYDESSHRVKFSYVSDSEYKITDHDVETFIPVNVINGSENPGRPFFPANDARIVLKGVRDINMEVALMTALTKSSNYDASNTSTPSTLWSDSTSDVLKDLNDAAEEVRDDKGIEPNRMIIERKVVRALKTHDQFIEAYYNSTTGKGSLSMLSTNNVLEIIANHLDMKVENIYVAGAKYINTLPGQTEARTDIWTSDVILYYAPESQSLFVPSFGYRLNLRGKGMNDTFKMRPHPNDPDLGEMIKNSWSYQDLILDWDSAYLLDGCI